MRSEMQMNIKRLMDIDRTADCVTGRDCLCAGSGLGRIPHPERQAQDGCREEESVSEEIINLIQRIVFAERRRSGKRTRTSGGKNPGILNGCSGASCEEKKKIHVDVNGKAFIKATFNNVIITLTDITATPSHGRRLGRMALRGRVRTPVCRPGFAEAAAKEAYDMGLRKVEVLSRDRVPAVKQAIRSLQTAGLEVSIIRDITPIPHNGCRPRSVVACRTVAESIYSSLIGSIHQWQDILTPVAGCAGGTAKALFEGNEMLHGKMPVERRNFPPVRTVNRGDKSFGIRTPASGETKDPKDVRLLETQFKLF